MAFRFPAETGAAGAEAELWSLGCRGIVEEGAEWVAFFDRRVDVPLAGRWEEVDDTDYVAAYQASLGPVDLGRLVVAPSHCRVLLGVGQRPLWLDPGMAFGSGHHETTRMALEALIERDPFGRDVLDVGAGSGILAIAADLLGARDAHGIDNDPLTLAVARDNARRNGSRAHFELALFDEDWPAASADLVVANLYAELHVALLDHYARTLRPGGALLMTGILAPKAGAVLAACPPVIEPQRTRSAGEWVLLEATRRSDP